jgi:hypothetical protein
VKLGEVYRNTAEIRAKSFSKVVANGHTSIKNLRNDTIQETELMSGVMWQGRGAAPEEHRNGVGLNLELLDREGPVLRCLFLGSNERTYEQKWGSIIVSERERAQAPTSYPVHAQARNSNCR